MIQKWEDCKATGSPSAVPRVGKESEVEEPEMTTKWLDAWTDADIDDLFAQIRKHPGAYIKVANYGLWVRYGPDAAATCKSLTSRRNRSRMEPSGVV